MSECNYDILDLRDAPHFFADVADRIWRTWWAPDGRSLADVETALRAIVAASDYPFTLVAARGDRFVGTVTSIKEDIGARPEWGPCLAALWVEPDARGQGIGVALADRLMTRLAGLNFERVYLSAEPRMRAYYLLRGWTLIDSDIDKDHQDVFVRMLGQE